MEVSGGAGDKETMIYEEKDGDISLEGQWLATYEDLRGLINSCNAEEDLIALADAVTQDAFWTCRWRLDKIQLLVLLKQLQ